MTVGMVAFWGAVIWAIFAVQARSLLDNGPEQPNADKSEEVV
ncbi:MAG TPA: hypothetical protein VLN74_12975 [Ilumatobacteraceae bacterium]|nr:hypothetical protein [Ilumatobacteraceae bacterium]